MSAYYNEIDPYAAQWLRNLISAGHIAPGDVDERSIEDVSPDDLRKYTQCHFFAGIGVWSYALRLAGWDDSRRIWTGSCPCQPFSAAGKGNGVADERHLWPAWFHLITQCEPPIVIGEQVASKDAEPWLDLVSADMEGLGFAFGALAFPSAGVGAPHIRDRTYWVGHASGAGLEKRERIARVSGREAGACTGEAAQRAGIHAVRLANADRGQLDGITVIRGIERDGADAGRPQGGGELKSRGDVRGMADASCERRQQIARSAPSDENAHGRAGRNGQQSNGDNVVTGDGEIYRIEPAGPTNGFWRDADWLLCRDEKFRPVEPGYEQMVDGSAGSLGRVRANDIAKIEEEINAWSIRYKADAGEALSRVWKNFQSQALCEREIGRFSGVRSPSVLLAFLRQLTNQGWRFSLSLACASSEASQAIMRVMQFDADAACTPLRRELEEQRTEQSSNSLRELSSIVAHYATLCWDKACRQKTGTASFPLSQNANSRVGRLRAYGNAINAYQAAEFIRAGLDL